jgi:hypothetical protein
MSWTENAMVRKTQPAQSRQVTATHIASQREKENQQPPWTSSSRPNSSSLWREAKQATTGGRLQVGWHLQTKRTFSRRNSKHAPRSNKSFWPLRKTKNLYLQFRWLNLLKNNLTPNRRLVWNSQTENLLRQRNSQQGHQAIGHKSRTAVRYGAIFRATTNCILVPNTNSNLKLLTANQMNVLNEKSSEEFCLQGHSLACAWNGHFKNGCRFSWSVALTSF